MIDFGIIGLGLAGSWLAITLRNHGYSILGIDNGSSQASSRIATGILNPITGIRATPNPLFPQHWQTSIRLYQQLEKTLNRSFLISLPITKLIQSQTESDRWHRLLNQSEWQAHLYSIQPDSHWRHYIEALQYPAHRLNVPVFLEAVHTYLTHSGQYMHTHVHHSDWVISENHIQWKQHRFKHVIFCTGADIQSIPEFDSTLFVPAKGEILTIHCPDLISDSIINWGKWLCPVGEHHFHLGATAYWHWTQSGPDHHRISELTQTLSQHLTHDYTVVNAQAGVRPSTRNRKAVFGFSTRSPRMGLINGFGSNGGILAPLIAEAFVNSFKNCPHFPIRSM